MPRVLIAGKTGQLGWELQSALLPLGGVVISRRIADTFKDRVFPGGLTYSGHPLAAASIVATIDIMNRPTPAALSNNLGSQVLATEYYRLVRGAVAAPFDADGRETDLFAGVLDTDENGYLVTRDGAKTSVPGRLRPSAINALTDCAGTEG